MKLTSLMFGLLLAVGWTSNAFAQPATYKAEDIKDWTYTWEDANGNTQTSKYIDEATNAYQMYGLLRWIYMDKRFPGPYQSAYKADGVTRERDVYYGGIDSGWEIPGIAIGNTATTTTITEYVKVNSIDELTSGEKYLIVYESGNRIMNGSLTTLDATNNYLTVTINNGTIASNATIDAATFTITATGNYYTILSASGYYMGRSTNQNGITTSTTVSTDLYNTIQITNGTVSIKGTASRYLRYNTSDNRFRYYGTTSSGVAYPQLYKRVTRTITTGGNTGIGDIRITGTNSYAAIASIRVYSGNTTLFNWTMANDFIGFIASTVPGMEYDKVSYYGNSGIAFNEDLDPIILKGWLFAGYNSVTVEIKAYNSQSNYVASLIVNGESNNITTPYSQMGTTTTTKTWTINAKTFAGPTRYQADQYKPSKEGYTALVVKLKNNISLAPDEPGFSQQSFYNSKDSIIAYFKRNIKSIQLLTDGLRIGEGDKVGTVFNAPKGEYNRFFFLSKGQARQKANMVLQEEVYREHLLGENVPFAQLFEQFSPTSGETGSDIFDFYSEMMQGKVYRIIHDCLSVMQNQHDFSMAGHQDTTAYAMTGMNFFIPDHRLQYWELTDTVKTYRWNSSTEKSEVYVKEIKTVDGRDMNPYLPASDSKTDDHSVFYKDPSDLAVWYAQYDTAQHAPLVGIYLLHLEAEANKVADYSEDNRYYNVDLDWTSSLNEMSNSEIPQTYIIYEVRTDSVTGEKYNFPIDTVKNVTELRLDTLYEQHQHSYPITYVIQGSPTDSKHPGFIAWSNTATVIIPGYDDFMILKLHHYEADFNVNHTVPQGKNYYRNYLQPENDIAKGITPEAILGGYDSFILYRSSTDGKVPVAKLKFAVKDGKVLYKITYFEGSQDTNWRNNIDIDAVIEQLTKTNN